MKIPLRNNGNKSIENEQKIFDLHQKAQGYIVPLQFNSKYPCNLSARSLMSCRGIYPLRARYECIVVNLDEKSRGICSIHAPIR